MGAYLDRAHDINRRMRQEQVTRARLQGFAYGALAAAGIVGGIAAGLSLPMSKPSIFELVAIHASGESDIVDYGLSATDCATNAAFAASLQPGASFECAPEINR